MYTDSEFDELDDEIYEIVLSYGQKKRKTDSETSLESKYTKLKMYYYINKLANLIIFMIRYAEKPTGKQ